MNNYGYEENVEFIKKYLDDEDWQYETTEASSGTAFKGSVGGFKGLYASFGFRMIVTTEGLVVSEGVFPASGSEKLPEIAEFIVRANHGLKYGAFDLDPSDGEITFHMAFPSDTLHADREWVGFMLLCPMHMLSQYAKGFTSVLMGLKTPEEAIADCESAKDDEEADD